MADGADIKVDADRLIQAVSGFNRVRILVLGDVMLDRFIWGSVGRISPEAPVPVVEVKSETAMLGGAANVLHNLIALGGMASICGLVGSDEPGRQVRGLLKDLEVDPEGLIACENRQTTVKTRVVAHSQQVVRVDREDRRQTGKADFDRMRDYLLHELPRCQAVIISDYAKGVITRPLIESLLGSTRNEDKTVAVDPKVVNMPLYKGCTIITPNHLEAVAAAGVSLEEADHVRKSGRKLLKAMDARYVLVTQGESGMTLFSPQEETHIATAAKRVFDVTGAGDTVISTLTLGLAVGLQPAEAAYLANLAAGVVVGEVGTSAVTGGRLIKVIQEAETSGRG